MSGMSSPRPLAATEPRGAVPARAGTEDRLVERYAQMAHSFESRGVDHALRALDIVLAVVGLTLAAPVMAVAAVGLRVSGRGPLLYRGLRVGRTGHVFNMVKFRTLAPDAETRLGPYLGPELTQLTSGEVTRLGRVLRAAKVDELPQLWNVLRGDMSMVGPRPIRPAFFEQLCYEIPDYWQRLVVRPGVTGLAQLRLTREMSWSEKLAHDFEFIADRSARLYLFVILTTVWLLLSRPFLREVRDYRLP
jgi:lipopolysaccharide/colanic/teichoic acid biosynthesis glycosyltransferase